MERDTRTYKYQKKKNNQKKHSTFSDNKHDEETKQIIQSLKNASLKQMFTFMEKSFDKYTEKSKKLHSAICLQITKRLPQIVKNQEQKFRDHTKKTLNKYARRPITDEDVKYLSEKANGSLDIGIPVKFTSTIANKGYYMTLVFQPQDKVFVSKNIISYPQLISDNLDLEPTLKRIKKETIQILETIRDRVDTLQNLIQK